MVILHFPTVEETAKLKLERELKEKQAKKEYWQKQAEKPLTNKAFKKLLKKVA